MSNKVVSCTALVFAYSVIAVIGAAIWGWVFSILWGWFIVPIFGVPQLTILYAIGISSVIGMFNYQKNQHKSDGSDDLDEVIYTFVYAVFSPLFSLFVGWIVYSLI